MKPRLAIRRRHLAYAALLVVLAFLFYNLSLGQVNAAMEKPMRRDPETGIIVGAEARDLGPADASRAALLVHGYVGCGRDFGQLPERLAERGWRVRVLLLPGHGTRARDLKKLNPDLLLDAVRKEYAALRAKHKTVALAGFSMGGSLSVLAAGETPPDALVLAAPYFGVTHRWYYGLRPETWAKALSGPVRWVYKGKLFLQLNRRENADKLISYPVLPTCSSVMLAKIGERAKAAEVLAAVKCPVLHIHSHNDMAASPLEAEKAFNQLGSTDKRLVWLARSNHHIFWDYEDEQVLTEILGFLQRFETPSAP
ncbi:MAG: alpha/beta fold hydrolase [FCB group bacterium]|jgi:carboxylesterase|nr:alpha/beta fold hydrolase [FCB group bacterium]